LPSFGEVLFKGVGGPQSGSGRGGNGGAI
jgi:hypothetical protein